MKQILFILILLQLSFNLKAQLSFEKIYTIHSWTQGTDIIEVDSSNYFCIGWDSKAIIDSSNNITGEHGTGLLIKLNSQGDTLKKVFIGWKDSVDYSSWGDFTYFRPQAINRTPDNNLFIAATFAPANPVSIYEAGVMMMKLDQNLDTIWTKREYSLNSRTYVWWTCSTNDNGFAMTGERTYNLTRANYCYILRVDSSGNILYDKNYSPDVPFIRITAQGICQTSDGGFLITGNEDDLNDFSVPFCIRTDNAGNELWRFTIPFSSRNNAAFNIVPTMDGNYVFGWCNQIRLPGAIYWMWINHMSKIDGNGNFIWTRDYFSSFDAFNLVKEFPDGKLAMYGWYADTLGNEGRQGMLTICDSSGQMLALKKYEGNGGGWSIMGGNFTSDGQMIFCGDTYCCNQTGNYGTSSLWIFKTDSLGLLNSIGKTQEELQNKIKWGAVYPNPTHGAVRLSISVNTENPFKECTLMLYNLKSHLLKEWSLKMGENEIETDLSENSSGDYLFIVSLDGFNAGGRKIVLTK